MTGLEQDDSSSCSTVTEMPGGCRASANGSVFCGMSGFFQAVAWLVSMPNSLGNLAMVRFSWAAARAAMALPGSRLGTEIRHWHAVDDVSLDDGILLRVRQSLALLGHGMQSCGQTGSLSPTSRDYRLI